MRLDTPRLALTWADIKAMPPGPRRDELAYNFRAQRAARYAKAAAEAEAANGVVAEARAVLAAIKPDPPYLIARRRKQLISADRDWVDPRRRRKEEAS